MLTKQGFVSKLLDNKILAKTRTICIFVICYTLGNLPYFKTILFKIFSGNIFILCISTAITSGILTFYFIEKPAAKYLKEKFLNIQNQ